MERSIKLSVCPSILSPAGGNLASANKPANSAVIKKTYLSEQSWFDDSASWWSIGSLVPEH